MRAGHYCQDFCEKQGKNPPAADNGVRGTLAILPFRQVRTYGKAAG
jgi:hypothetical protein